MRFEKTTCPSSYLYGPAQEGWTKKEIIRPAFKKPRHYGVDLDFLARACERYRRRSHFCSSCKVKLTVTDQNFNKGGDGHG